MYCMDTNRFDANFEKIYEEYKPLVAFIAKTYLEDESLIDDVIQDVFLDLFKNYNKIKNVKAYLSTITKNRAIALDKDKKRTVLINSFDSLSYEEIKGKNDLSVLIDELSAILSTTEINIIFTHLVDGTTFKDMAGIFKCKEASIKSIYYRALKKCEKGELFK